MEFSLFIQNEKKTILAKMSTPNSCQSQARLERNVANRAWAKTKRKKSSLGL
jgi:hypothetical protein